MPPAAASTLASWRERLSFAAVKAALKEHGPAAAVIYASAWAVPALSLYGGCLATDNFGIGDPLGLVPTSWREAVMPMVGLAPDATLSPAHTSLLLAYLGADILEPGRIALTLWGAPKLSAAYKARRAAA